MDIISRLAEELNIRKGQAEAAVTLLDEGNTVPFIARYRKDVTDSLNDEQLIPRGCAFNCIILDQFHRIFYRHCKCSRTERYSVFDNLLNICGFYKRSCTVVNSYDITAFIDH